MSRGTYQEGRVGCQPGSVPNPLIDSYPVPERLPVRKASVDGCRFRSLHFAFCVTLLALLPGCALLGGSRAQPIGEIHLFGLPTALAIPGSTLPGGIGVRIYASEAGGAHGLPIKQGRLEVLVFDQAAVGLNPQK